MSQYPGPDRASEPAPAPVRISLPASVPHVTYMIVGITGLIYLLQLGSVALLGYASPAARMDLLMAFGARVNELIRAGQFWRFLTPVLLHASVPHILFNMYALVAFGAGLERYFGHVRFLTLYVLAGFTGNVLSFLLSDGYSVGASTAVFGLVGAEGIFLYQNRGLLGSQFGRAIGNVFFIVAVNLAMGLTPGIDNWGHLGGLVGGAIFAWLAGPRYQRQDPFYPSGIVDVRDPGDTARAGILVFAIFAILAGLRIF